MKHQIIDQTGITISSNLEPYCSCCLNQFSTERIFKTQCPQTNKTRKFGSLKQDNGSVFICSEQPDDLKSNRTFKNKISAYASTIDYLSLVRANIKASENKTANRIIHNLVTKHALGVQELYGFVPQDILRKNIKSQFKIIRDEIKHDIDATTRLILAMLKNHDAMRAEFVIFEYLQSDDALVSFEPHSIHKVLLNVLHPLYSDFNAKGVYVDVQNIQLDISLHYDTFRVALYLICENAIKYTKKNTILNVNFEINDGELCIIFDMMSTKIMDHEKELIFTEGYSGELPSEHEMNGKGIGMYRIRRLLGLNRSDLAIVNNVTPSDATTENSIEYQRNQFIIVLRKSSKRGRLSQTPLSMETNP